MTTVSSPMLFLCVLISLFFSSSAQTCQSYTFSSNRQFSSCSDLPVLNSYLHWTYSPSAGSVQIAYRHTGVTTSNWVAWAINPTSQGMIGAQALVAYQQSNGSMLAYTSPVTSVSTSLAEGNLSFQVSDLLATFDNNEMTIFATIELPNNLTTVNQVWQVGPVDQSTPRSHTTSGDNINSKGSLNFLSGQTTTTGNSVQRRRNVHGVLNAISWGTLMPLGAIIARYLKVFKSADPAWFYLHVACQSSAYIIGIAGWATGIKLGSDSAGIVQHAHRNIGIVLFCFGTLQVLALLLRPNKDHKYRFYWNIYHHSIGYSVIILSVINIFKGFDILQLGKNWKRAYIGIIVFLGFNFLMLEAITWNIVLKRRSRSSEKSHHGVNGVNGVNGYYGDRSQEVV
ncbi:PREDICTED: cytochrome b561 and DOMON domain-containing protein At5g47530-like [Nelumbo nucifera]|uniref:Cytochrome b561 and DOMON domain-containing protein n=1 Tax=Nelumbo nucifera TaxID=4432 RepID=A0A1U8B2D5_NELNU|nr:PREDICTED: cytochrome b561 and DOMON domain-containing protein At5g47530-like [Nelumbo nucifera]